MLRTVNHKGVGISVDTSALPKELGCSHFPYTQIGYEGVSHYVVVTIFGYGVKPGWKGQVGGVQHVHMYSRKTVYRIKGEYLSDIVTSLPPWAIKGREGSLLKGLPILSRKGIPFCRGSFFC